MFRQPDGEPVGHERDHVDWTALLADAGVLDARLHDARHTAASLLLALEVPSRVVMEVLGHSSYQLTMHTCSSVAPELDQEAARLMTGARSDGGGAPPSEPAAGTQTLSDRRNRRQPGVSPVGEQVLRCAGGARAAAARHERTDRDLPYLCLRRVATTHRHPPRDEPRERLLRELLRVGAASRSSQSAAARGAGRQRRRSPPATPRTPSVAMPMQKTRRGSSGGSIRARAPARSGRWQPTLLCRLLDDERDGVRAASRTWTSQGSARSVPGVDPRPPPPVTITGGPGWALAPHARETVEAGSDDDLSTRWSRGRQVTALLLAAALGFVAASLLAERRQSALEDSPQGVLSLDLAAQEPQFTSDLVALDEGAAVQTAVVLRNTGPRTVSLESVELGTTGYAADDVTGRRMAPGSTTAVRLLRPVRCDDLAPLGAIGPLEVRATTGAGPRMTRLRMDMQMIEPSQGFARAACGLAPPELSLVAIDAPAAGVVGGRAEVGFELSNASKAPLVLTSLELPAGLRLVTLQDADARPVVLPLRLPAGDYDPPTQPMLGRGAAQRLVAVIEVADCAAMPGRTQDDMYVPLFSAAVTGEGSRVELEGRDGAYGGFGPGSSQFGDPMVVHRLRERVCPDASRR
jgi:hypothetical protein